jgi:hypothetical protein
LGPLFFCSEITHWGVTTLQSRLRGSAFSDADGPLRRMKSAALAATGRDFFRKSFSLQTALNSELRAKRSDGSDRGQQIGMKLKHLEQLHQGQGRPGLAIFVA